ncbi:DMT family transporter [Achromobacter ruhlandii]|uniref:DMT family transporter n=1 Tax=Achromobacter ruhlandii TaxID=72557 RepID=UPI0021F0C346|nr:DMT family transporter [Achromobacter ruhlandii]MCV6796515.1 DMT family transporter [Achromobacter ruhlandii]MCV6804624.1 DMT family transporter [Achromobacter ruhlandii]MCV6809123.1 DMT family transporter [Achromobacter ruhlandii]MCV6820965.1 DMT family transporter [Achromobacter ruhlandii]
MSHVAAVPARTGLGLSGTAMLLAAPALFASNMVAARWAHDAALPPVFLAFGRWLIAFLILLPLAAPALLRHRQALWRGLPTLLPLAVLGMGVAVAPQYIGAQSTSATNIALIFSCSPILVALLEAIIWRKPLSPLRAAGLALALGGVLVVLTRGDAWALARLAFGQGDLWVLLAATGWALYTVLQKRLAQPAVPDGARLAAMMLGGAIALAPFAGIEAATGATPPWSDPRLAAVLLFLAVVPSLGAYYVYGRLISRAGPATAGLSMFLVPVYAALLAWPLLGEAPQLFHAYGFVMILLGVKLASSRMRATTAGAAAPA